MRYALALIPALLLGRTAHATPQTLLHAQVRADMSFEGLDLSDDDKPKKTDKKKTDKKKNDKKKNDKKKPDETPTAPDLTVPTVPDKKDPGPTIPDLTKPDKKPDPKDTKPAAPMSFDAIDVTGKSANRQKIDGALGLFKKQQYEESALALQEILKDPANAEIQPEAKYLLGKSLYRLGLYHSSLQMFHDVLAGGASGKFFKSSLEWLFFIAHKTVNEEIILDEVAKFSSFEFPPKFQSEFRYLISKYHFNRGKALLEAQQQAEGAKELDEASKGVLTFPKADAFYGKAQYLEGLIAFAQGKQATSLESFKEVVRANNPKSNGTWDEHLRELAFMQLARTHYGSRQNRYAIYYFDRIPAGSDQWLESLFEASWAHFRIGQYEKALGNMITLQAPFFRDEYFPEALILKAVIYYENCRYKEARAILDDFDKTYHPVRDELERIVKEGEAKNDAQYYFDTLEGIEKKAGTGQADVVLSRILKLALTDKDLKGTNDSILEVEKEMDHITTKSDVFKFSDLSKELGENLKKERATLIGKASLIARAKIQKELRYLTELLSQGLRIQFETSTKEKEFFQASLGDGAKREVVSGYRYVTAVSDDEVYWPYEGEYWRDELGTYQYTLTKGCKNSEQGKSDDSGAGGP
jgi:tetratricopeptide (TPR) repeat protein